MKILINDDSRLDRTVLRKILEKNSPEYEIVETSNLDEFYHELYKGTPCHLLFQDISLSGNEESPDSEGLNVLYDIVNDFPGLPVVIITGYYYEKIREFHKVSLSRTLQFIDYLDKGSYGEADVLSALIKAEDFRQSFKDNSHKQHTADELLREIALLEENRIKQTDGAVQEIIGQLKEDLRYRDAFSGEDWEKRLRTEYEITGRTCSSNSATLGVMNETIVLKSFMGKNDDYPNLKRKIDWLRENSKITGDEYLVVDRARALRNKILHGNKQAYLSDGLRLLEAHNILQKIQSS